ncbi:MAG TPA: polyprenyl diphosphate synthase [Thermoanaerobaculia bacterium]|jgi:undecaprenyl diphosphate synthase
MTQSTFHVAIIMDGNGRWATERGLSRTAGHRAGAEAVRRVVEAAPGQGVRLLTLYAFSSDNWSRPRAEVDALMMLLQRFLSAETARCVDEGVRINVIGRRDRLSPRLVRLIEATEAATGGGEKLRLRLAIDYSSRDAIARASCERCSERTFRQRLAYVTHADSAAEDVDLLIRTGREKRLSDFLLYEAAYAELHFSDRFWPDFCGDDLARAVADYRGRHRRFGAVAADRTVTESGEDLSCKTHVAS